MITLRGATPVHLSKVVPFTLRVLPVYDFVKEKFVIPNQVYVELKETAAKRLES